MRPDRVLSWLVLASIAACSPGIVMLSGTHHCWGVPSLCSTWGSVPELIASDLLALLLLIVLAARGLLAGARQLSRTRATVGHILGLPRAQLPAHIRRVARGLKILGRIDIVRSPIAAAFCHGLFRPRICVTTGLVELLSAPEIEAVLRHEQHHLLRRDPLRTLLWTVVDAACWWMEHGAQEARLRHELAADRAVISAVGRVSLASALLKLLAHEDGCSMANSDLAVSGLSVTNARIDQLLRPDCPLPRCRPLYAWLVLPATLGMLLLLCSA